MGDIKWKTCCRGLTLNLEEILQKPPENKKYGTRTSRECYTFSLKRNEACSHFIDGVISEKPL